MDVVVATHGHCFDGLASAVVFTWLIRQLEGENTTFRYHACGYGPGQKAADDALFTGEHNAILDYRFTSSTKLNWFFDHHRTAFLGELDRAYFNRYRAERHYFFDPDFSSCAKFIWHTAQSHFGLHGEQLAELVRWADIVDSAAFSSAHAAIDRTQPVMRLVSVVEQHGNDAFLGQLVTELLHKPLAEVAASEAVTRRFEPIGGRHRKYADAVRTFARQRGRVVLVDLTEQPLDLIGKFVTYALYPESVYSVVAVRVQRGYKISVGYNPWSGQQLDTDISAICAQYGGGGHKVVGGISLPDGQGEKAREIARTIAEQLQP